MPNTDNPNDQSDLSRFMKVVGDSLNEAATKVNDSIPEDWKKKGAEIGRTISTKTEEVGDYIVKSGKAAFEHITTIPDHINGAYKSVSTSISDLWNQANQTKAASTTSYAEQASASGRKGRQMPQRSDSIPSLAESSVSLNSISSRSSRSSGGVGRRYPHEIKVTNVELPQRGGMFRGFQNFYEPMRRKTSWQGTIDTKQKQSQSSPKTISV